MTRYCFVRDDDGHNYMIPVFEKDRFNELCYGDNGDDYATFNNEFEHYCIDSMTNWTFTEPKENA